jgi:antitoxin ParD1/3/4
VLYYTNSKISDAIGEEYMATTRKTITLTKQQDQWVKAQITSGDYTNDSEYFRDLVRRDQEQNSKFLALKRAIQEGLDSGVSNRTVAEIWEDAEQRFKAKHG